MCVTHNKQKQSHTAHTPATMQSGSSFSACKQQFIIKAKSSGGSRAGGRTEQKEDERQTKQKGRIFLKKKQFDRDGKTWKIEQWEYKSQVKKERQSSEERRRRENERGVWSWPDIQLTGRIKRATTLMSDLVTQHGLTITSYSNMEQRHTDLLVCQHLTSQSQRQKVCGWSVHVGYFN